MFDYIDLHDFWDGVDMAVGENDLPAPKPRGRPPLSIPNPLNDVPLAKFVNSEGRPQVWLDDCLMGAIRTIGLNDSRKTTTANYVSLNKVFKTLLNLSGSLTTQRIATALGVSSQTGWRILKVIQWATFSINRSLGNPSRIVDYRTPANYIRRKSL